MLGYLLGALDASEREQLEAHLADDPQLQSELQQLQACMQPLADEGAFEPPGDLKNRTVQYVMDRRGPEPGQFAAQSSWRLQDLAVAACLFITATALFFQAVFSSRQCAQLQACQKNLANMGQALIQFSQVRHGEFPYIPLEGNLAAAGIYAPQLRSTGLIEPRDVICPGSALAMDPDFQIPSLVELAAARGEELRRLQARMGGSYGYSLGYVENGRYHGLRNQARASFALMADAPADPIQGTTNHGSCGQNVLFEDGRVVLLKVCRLADDGDHIFQNSLGHIGVGIGPHDSVISPSATIPLLHHWAFELP